MGTNRKSHTRFRLVPKSLTLDDLERPSTAKTHCVELALGPTRRYNKSTTNRGNGVWVQAAIPNAAIPTTPIPTLRGGS